MRSRNSREAHAGRSLARLTAGSFLLLLIALTLGTGCHRSMGPKFDPYSTNLVVHSSSLTGVVVVTNKLDPALLQPSHEPFRLGPGDKINIELLGGDSDSQYTFVGPDGKIYFDLLQGVQVWGLTLEEAKKVLEERLKTYVRNPQVAISLREVGSKHVWIMGRAHAPGLYPITGPMTVIEAITKAGGLFSSRLTGTTEELADLEHSFIVRRGEYLPVNFQKLLRGGDTSQNIYLEPDDMIYLPSSLASQVFVIGAVGQPRAVGFNDELTLISAIATARGTIPNAWLREVVIIRGSLSQPSVGLVDLTEILRGKKPDVRLQPRDIIYVPFSPYRKIEKYVNQAVNTFVRGAAANAGGITPGISVTP